MKLKYVLCILLFVTTVTGAPVYNTLTKMNLGVRHTIKTYDTDVLPDSVLYDLCARALKKTSVEVGGIETQYKFNTDTGQARYGIPDTIVQVIFAELVVGNITKSLKAYYPQYYEDDFKKNILTEDDESSHPDAYKIWGDSIRLYPTPLLVDSIYLDCFVEHKVVTTGTDSVGLEGDFLSAAVEYTAYLALRHLGLYDRADRHMAEYVRISTALKTSYARRMDVRTGTN